MLVPVLPSDQIFSIFLKACMFQSCIIIAIVPVLLVFLSMCYYYIMSWNMGRPLTGNKLSPNGRVVDRYWRRQMYICTCISLCRKGCYTVLYNACIRVLCTRYTRVIRMCITLRMDTLYTVAYNNYSITLCITSV